MGRVTEFIDFINSKPIRGEEERDFIYSHLTVTDKIKQIRKQHLKELKK
tara:strand:- start:423 stop:569 length:147 start_codon:yes stop_codon:yes gene_type:complete